MLKKRGLKAASPLQSVDKKLFSPEGGRIALSANERIVEFLDFAIQAKFAYVNKLTEGMKRQKQSSKKEKGEGL